MPLSVMACGAGKSLPDVDALYGDRLRFSVLRNGEPVGFHTATFQRAGADLIVDSRFELAVRIMAIPVYRFQYASRDVWRDGCLVSLEATTNDGGRSSAVRAAARGDRLAISGPAGELSADMGLFPTNHWHAGVIGSRQVLNTITGQVADVTIVDRGPTQVPTSAGVVTARHFQYSGDLRTEVWYDEAGRWVKMRFEGKDGSTIEYLCESCGDRRPGPA